MRIENSTEGSCAFDSTTRKNLSVSLTLHHLTKLDVIDVTYLFVKSTNVSKCEQSFRNRWQKCKSSIPRSDRSVMPASV